jgi:hypothetical protein
LRFFSTKSLDETTSLKGKFPIIYHVSSILTPM